MKKEVAESLDRSVARSIDRLVARSLGFCSYFAGNKNKTRFGPAGDELQNIQKLREGVFASLWLGAFFVGSKGKIRPRGTKSEAPVVIVKRRIKQHQSHQYSFRRGALFARISHFFMEA